PARFQLVATMNLCPCGARGDPAQECSCSPQRLAAFRDKLSRALLDRFDLVVTVPRPRAHELAAGPSEASEAVAVRVAAARERLRRSFDEADFRARLSARGIRWIGRSETGFPAALGSIFDPPAGLFLRGAGALELLDRPAVAIVGARACSAYGSHVARTFGRELAAAGLVVVSGMARGVDGDAHRGALEAGGTTVAVLGCGVDR